MTDTKIEPMIKLALVYDPGNGGESKVIDVKSIQNVGDEFYILKLIDPPEIPDAGGDFGLFDAIDVISVLKKRHQLSYKQLEEL